MKSDNLIKGQKPEFGNPDHIKWLQEQSEIMNGEINFGEIVWEYGIYIGGGGKTKPGIKRDVSLLDADCVYCYVLCPKCKRYHILFYCFDPQGLWTEELIEIDNEVKNGFECYNCGLEMYAEDRLLYVR